MIHHLLFSTISLLTFVVCAQEGDTIDSQVLMSPTTLVAADAEERLYAEHDRLKKFFQDIATNGKAPGNLWTYGLEKERLRETNSLLTGLASSGIRRFKEPLREIYLMRGLMDDLMHSRFSILPILRPKHVPAEAIARLMAISLIQNSFAHKKSITISDFAGNPIVKSIDSGVEVYDFLPEGGRRLHGEAIADVAKIARLKLTDNAQGYFDLNFGAGMIFYSHQENPTNPNQRTITYIINQEKYLMFSQNPKRFKNDLQDIVTAALKGYFQLHPLGIAKADLSDIGPMRTRPLFFDALSFPTDCFPAFRRI
jgi:hypothetical protein